MRDDLSAAVYQSGISVNDYDSCISPVVISPAIDCKANMVKVLGDLSQKISQVDEFRLFYETLSERSTLDPLVG